MLMRLCKILYTLIDSDGHIAHKIENDLLQRIGKDFEHKAMLQIAFTQHLHLAYESSTKDWKEILSRRRREALGTGDNLGWEQWKVLGEDSGHWEVSVDSPPVRTAVWVAGFYRVGR
jgi:hypothetical protein